MLNGENDVQLWYLKCLMAYSVEGGDYYEGETDFVFHVQKKKTLISLNDQDTPQYVESHFTGRKSVMCVS